MRDGWVKIRASDTGQKPKSAPDSVLLEYHPQLNMVRIKRGEIFYLIALDLYVRGEWNERD